MSGLYWGAGRDFMYLGARRGMGALEGIGGFLGVWGTFWGVRGASGV